MRRERNWQKVNLGKQETQIEKAVGLQILVRLLALKSGLFLRRESAWKCGRYTWVHRNGKYDQTLLFGLHEVPNRLKIN